jgi:hypothetical protein
MKKISRNIIISLIVTIFVITSIFPALNISSFKELKKGLGLEENDSSSEQPVTITNINEIIESEKLNPNDYGGGYIEHMDVCVERDEILRSQIDVDPDAKQGIWSIPTGGSTYYPYSGKHYAVNKWGDTMMGISFPSKVNLQGAWFAGQGADDSIFTDGIRVHGYLNGYLTQTTNWFKDIDETPSWFDINLHNIDRIVIEAIPVYNGAGWYAMDDFTYSILDPIEQDTSSNIVLDFEDTIYKQDLNKTKYGGLIWETGTGKFLIDENETPLQNEKSTKYNENNPAINPSDYHNFQGVIRGDAESWSYPPDTCGVVGPNHFVETVNRNFAVYDKSTGEELINIHLGSFLPGCNGDPRVLFDQYSDRWFVIVCDFNTKIFLAASTSDDPTDEWFKCDFVVSQGSDAGKWPDYPTLGVDEDGIYTAAYMIGGSYGMSIFALEKAPLIASEPSLGEIYAFRELPWEGAIQPAHTFGDSNGEYFVSRSSSSGLRVRRLTNLLTDPELTELCYISIPNHLEPPNAPALGSSVPLNTVGHRLMNAVYRDGYIWTAHCIGLDGRAASRWYKIDVSGSKLDDYGTISDSVMHYFFPSIIVNSEGNAIMGFTGSSSEQYASAYYTTREADDPPGEMDPPTLLKEGEASYNLVDGYGRNRWGDYSLCSVDPIDDTLWTIQEYAHSHNGSQNRWGTWIIKIGSANRAPGKPSIEGPSDGKTNTPYDYTFNAVDPDDNDLFYYIKWGDGYIETWEGPQLSGEDLVISHTYSNEGEFSIQAKVKDIHDLESGWTTMNVTMPRTKDTFSSFFNRLIERFSILNNILLIYRALAEDNRVS